MGRVIVRVILVLCFLLSGCGNITSQTRDGCEVGYLNAFKDFKDHHLINTRNFLIQNNLKTERAFRTYIKEKCKKAIPGL